MKKYKITFIISLFASVISLIIAILDFAVFNSYNGILKDICLAVFSSALFVAVVSLVDYFVTKSEMLREIYNAMKDTQSGWNLLVFSNKSSKDYIYTEKDIICILKSSIDGWGYLKNCLFEYYDGGFFVRYFDKDIRKIIFNIEKYITDLIIKVDIPIVKFDIEKYVEENERLNKTVAKWLRRKGLKFLQFKDIQNFKEKINNGQVENG